jgi:hypothetical protein
MDRMPAALMPAQEETHVRGRRTGTRRHTFRQVRTLSW